MFRLLFLLLCLTAAVSPVSACVHTPRTYKGTVTEKTEEALLFHDGVNAHLIIRTNLQATSGSLPETMAWVIPLPSLPSHYEEVDPALFPELFQVVEKASEAHERSIFALKQRTKTAETAPPGILVHPMQVVGSYQVQPIEVLDPKSAGGELNHWLLANGFGTVSPQHQRPYLRKGAVFLALKIHGLRGGFSEIKPLHIVYKSETLSLPLKFANNFGTFNVDLYAFTPHALDSGLLRSDNLSGDTSVEIKSAADAPLLWRLAGRRGFLTRFEGYGFNGTGAAIRSLKTDPTIDLRRDNSPRSAFAFLPENDFNAVGGWRTLAAGLVVALSAETWRRKRRTRQING